MVDAIVSFAVERLGDLLISESKLLYRVSNQVDEVRRDLQRMQNFLIEADKKQIRDERVRGWVREIKELAFRTEDVIEIYALQVATNSGFKGVLQRCACISRRNVAMEINDIQAKLANIQQSLPTFGITKGLEEGQTSNSQVNQRISFPHDIGKDFIGMEKEIEQLLSYLKKEDEGHEVVSIWGMGGLGKTTVAQRLYNHVDIRDHFRAFAWVCISQQCDKEKALKEILQQLLPDNMAGVVSNMGVMKLVDELRKVQQENKCLVVIDDIWTIDSWRSLEPAFPLEKSTSGCKILLTTRNLTLAEIGSVCKISGLTEDEGWQLLSKKARIYDQPDIRLASEMERIGRSMVKRCKGLPLAISALGGILKGKHLLKEWEKINSDIPYYLTSGEGVNNDDEYYTVRRVLGLSYDNLPSRLRHCFLCFANYKEDDIIETEELYMFWMAEGLISVEDKMKGEMMSDVAERYLDELAHRSLVKVETQYAEGESWLKYKECVVHDLIHDLCLSKVKEEGVINVIDLEHNRDNEFKGSQERRLCVRSYDGNKDVFKPYEQRVISHVRSLFIWNDKWGGSVVLPDKIFSTEKFKLLRVLTARGYTFSEQHIRSISELVYLKYLCLQACDLNSLPTSIGKLRTLETLDLRTRGDHLSIPNVLWKLKMLKHLYLPWKSYQVRGRGKKLRFEGLNELEVVDNFDSDYCDAHDLIRLPKLKVFHGDITTDEKVTTKHIAEFAKSRELRHTEIELKGREVCLISLLKCCFTDILQIGSFERSTPMYEFPKADKYNGSTGRLTCLLLRGFRMEEDPMILLEKLPNLRCLGFHRSEYLGGGEIVCSAMSFLKLERLELDRFKGLREVRMEQGAMPNLSTLFIQECLELEMFPEGLRHLTSLNSLHISKMPITFTDKIKVIEGVEGQDFYKVRHIPRLSIF